MFTSSVQNPHFLTSGYDWFLSTACVAFIGGIPPKFRASGLPLKRQGIHLACPCFATGRTTSVQPLHRSDRQATDRASIKSSCNICPPLSRAYSTIFTPNPRTNRIAPKKKRQQSIREGQLTNQSAPANDAEGTDFTSSSELGDTEIRSCFAGSVSMTVVRRRGS